MLTLKKNWHWMLFVLVIFGGIGVVLFTQLNTDTEPKTVYKLPSEETLQKIREKAAARKAQADDGTNRPPPPGETHETGYWHGDHWHRTAPSVNEKQAARDGTNVLPSTTENPKRRKWLREGEVKPGHFYSFDEDGYLVCDENGNLIQTPYGDPAFHIFTTIGFRPTYEEYQEYKKLVTQGNAAYMAGNMAEYNRLVAEVLQFRRDHQGEVPDLTASTVFPDDHTPATPEANARFDRMVVEKHNQLYREWGLGYLLED
ncbi:hypothetical protein C6501_04925 [Candidatus Poribacteria bacterium]|nr:MAG: hypothetical protein C6501_04925 [Candidatus Poribacteria bacterium]